MSAITLTACKSSAFTGYAYDSATKVLHVQFQAGGKVHQHHGVPPEKALALAGAESMGKFYAAEIRGKYPAKAPE